MDFRYKKNRYNNKKHNNEGRGRGRNRDRGGRRGEYGDSVPNRQPYHTNNVCLSSRLNTGWNVWAHDRTDHQFTDDSYKKCFRITNWEQFWLFFNNIKDYSRHQFYFMRGDILPKYETPENINGGAVSFMIHETQKVKSAIIQLLVRVFSENLLKNPNDYKYITGVCLIPKIDGANVKIWISDFYWLQQNVNEMNFHQLRWAMRSQRICKHNTN